MSLGLRALLLDLDGTLVDSRRDIARACNAALVAVGRPELDEARVVSFVGDGARLLLARALEVDASAPIVDEALEPFLESYLAHPVEHTVLLPGVRETLAHLVERGVLLALATNKPRPVAVAVLEGLGILPWFPSVAAGGDVPRLKPDPAVLERAYAGLGSSRPPRSAVGMVGDSPVDVVAGRAFGATTIAVLGPFVPEHVLRASGPDHLLERFADLEALVVAR